MKPGWQTSEMAVSLAGIATVALNKKLGLELSATDIMSLAGLVLGFVGSRWHLKVATAQAPEIAK